MNVPRGIVVSLVAVGLVVSLVGGAFLSLDFGVREGAATTETEFVSDAVNDSTARFDEGVVLHVRGDTSGRATSALVAAFEARGISVTVSETLDRQYDGNVLVVTVDDGRPRWTPLSASDTSAWRFFYTTTGNTTSVDEDDRVVVVRDGDDTSRIYYLVGSVTTTDQSSGLFTRPAYDRHVTGQQSTVAVDAFLRAGGVLVPTTA